MTVASHRTAALHLEAGAEQVGRTPSTKAGRAVEQLHRETGHRTETVVKCIVEKDAQYANTILDLAEQLAEPTAERTNTGR